MTDPLTAGGDRALRDAARDWTMRTADPAFAEWDGFTAWLEADPRHNAAYQAALNVDEDIAAWFETEPVRPMTSTPPPRRTARWAWGGGAIAASLAVVLGWSALDGDRAPYAIETGPGERRQIALEDGSRIDLNGAARIILDADTPRLASLERGEALFTVRHDERDPFVVNAGPSRLVDIGTVFNVVRSDGATRVAVSEGAVIYNPEAEAVRLDPGKALEAVDAAGTVRVSSIAPQAVGSWRERRLIYAGASVADVAADLSRNLGVSVAVEGVVVAPFTGTLAIDGDAPAVLDRVAPLLGVTATRRGEGWLLSPSARP